MKFLFLIMLSFNLTFGLDCAATEYDKNGVYLLFLLFLFKITY